MEGNLCSNFQCANCNVRVFTTRGGGGGGLPYETDGDARRLA